MKDDDTIVNLSDHKAKLEKSEKDADKLTTSAVNPSIPPDVLKELNSCLTHSDMEATLRVFEILRSMGDEVNIKIDHEDIYISIHQEDVGNIDAGVEFPEQVVKASATYQTSTINFRYVEEEWDSLENFIYNTGFSLRRCIESLTYWATGDEDE